MVLPESALPAGAEYKEVVAAAAPHLALNELYWARVHPAVPNDVLVVDECQVRSERRLGRLFLSLPSRRSLSLSFSFSLLLVSRPVLICSLYVSATLPRVFVALSPSLLASLSSTPSCLRHSVELVLIGESPGEWKRPLATCPACR